MAPHTESNLKKTEYVPFEVRYPKILAEIEDMVSFDAILGFQETGTEFKERISEYFKKVNYSHYLFLYDKTETRGNMIAFPNKYTLIDSGFVDIGKKLEEKCSSLSEDGYAKCYRDKKNEKNEKSRSVPKLIASRKNLLSYVKLSYENCNFYVFNCHVPLNFLFVQIMGVYVVEVMENISLIAEQLPYVLLTDLNNSPESFVYRYITEARIKNGLKIHRDFNVYVPTPLIDARSVLGVKGNTVNSMNPKGNIFSECIDYIFLSRNWKPEGFYQKYCEYEGEKNINSLPILPSLYDGSDHIPSMCECTLIT